MNNLFNSEIKTPDFRLIVNGKDISSIISNRLISLSVTDSRGLDGDMLQIELQDSTCDLELPPLNAEVHLALGWKGEPLTDKGIYLVSELEYSGAPNKLTLTATSADLRATTQYGLSSAKSRSFDDIALGELVDQIAKEHGLKSHVSAGLKGIRIKHIDQTGESDISLLSRMAENYNGMVSVKNKTLLFIIVGKGLSASGKRLPTEQINLTDCSSFNYRELTRDAYTGIIVYWNDISGAKRNKVIIGTTERSKELKQTYANEEEARRGAQAELERLARANKSLSFTLTRGRTELMAETPLRLYGFISPLQATLWSVTSAVHTLNDQGLTSFIEAEPMNTANRFLGTQSDVAHSIPGSTQTDSALT